MFTIFVISTKGGVGKSSISVALASVLSKNGKVGLLDADVTNPCINILLGIDKTEIKASDLIEPIEIGKLKVFSTAFLLDDKNIPVLWKGEKRRRLLEQYIADINWGNLDYMVVDLPPGTSDEPLFIMESINSNCGAVVVTTPWDISINNVRKAISMCKKLNVPIIGVIENMSGFKCPNCGQVFDTGNQDKVPNLCKEFYLNYLGKIPLDFNIATDGDVGNTNTLENNTNFLSIVSKILTYILEESQIVR